MRRPLLHAMICGPLLCLAALAPEAQELTREKVSGPLSERRALGGIDHPAIGYSSQPFDDVVARLNRHLEEQGAASLTFDAESGYLNSLLDALKLSRKSQVLVYSKSSLQARHISPSNPRALYFSDDVVLGYIRGAPFIEVAALDPKKGVQLYTLTQRESPTPQLSRGTDCLRCHESLASLDVPGMLLRSSPTDPSGESYPQFGNYVTDHRSPLDQRWGGWYVTGGAGRAEHMGNLFLTTPQDPDTKVTGSLNLASLDKRFDPRGYPTPFSDVAALLVFEHQMHMTNLLVRVGWDARAALSQWPRTVAQEEIARSLLANNAREIVDYMLFVDEAPLSGVVGTSTFAQEFSARGPFDKKGRSLRQLDLSRRLMRYPLSYMIYSEAFDALPPEMKGAIYERLWAVLSSSASDPAYRHLSAADRRALIEILRDTKPELPAYFG